MMNFTLLNPGVPSLPTGLPGAPPTVATGATPPDFAAALAILATGAMPAAPAAEGAATRQELAVIGKNAPVGAKPARLTLGDFKDSVSALPALLPDPALMAAMTIDPADDAAPVAPGESDELAEPMLEPALAWLMPLLPVPVAPPVPTRRTTSAEVSDPVVACPVGAAPLPTLAGADQPATEQKPVVAPPPIERQLSAALPSTDLPASPAPPAAPPARPSVAAAAVPLPQPIVLAAIAPIGPAAEQSTTPITTKVAASPWLRAPVAVTNDTTTASPGTTRPREPLAAIPEAQLRAAATQRVEIQPVAAPARDSGALLAAAAAIRTAPATASVDGPANLTLGNSLLDTGALAPIAAGAPAAAPVAASQQAGIDLTRDPGLNQMIDRIEQLRDAFDARDTRIRLIPDALGPVDIAVRRDGAGDAVQIHFTAAEAGTRQLIADTQHRLIEIADSRGVRIERATVDGGSAAGGTGHAWNGDGQPRPQQQAAQSAQPPRAPAHAARDGDDPSTDERIA